MSQNKLFSEQSRSNVTDLVCIVSSVLALVSALIGWDAFIYRWSMIGLSCIFALAVIFRLNVKTSLARYFVPVIPTLFIIYLGIGFGSELGVEHYFVIGLVAMTWFAENNVIRYSSIILFIVIAVGVGIYQRYHGPLFMLPKAVDFLYAINILNPLVIVTVMSLRLLAQINKSHRVINFQKSKLKKSIAFKDRVISVLGHDMKAPFLSAKGLWQLLSQNDLDPLERQQLMERLQSDIDLSILTLDNILDWASQSYFADVMQKKANLKRYDIHAMVELTIDGFRSLALSKSIKFENNLVAPTFVIADEQQLFFVLRNLTSNALKFSHLEGLVSYHAHVEGGMLHVCVNDEGIGIDPKILGKLFKIDSRKSTRGTAQEKGSGLGLILCKEFVENNQGKIWIDSKVNEGTKIFFSIPLAV